MSRINTHCLVRIRIPHTNNVVYTASCVRIRTKYILYFTQNVIYMYIRVESVRVWPIKHGPDVAWRKIQLQIRYTIWRLNVPWIVLFSNWDCGSWSGSCGFPIGKFKGESAIFPAVRDSIGFYSNCFKTIELYIKNIFRITSQTTETRYRKREKIHP